MTINIRVPFDDSINSRDTTLTKDSLITNAFCDEVTEGTTIVKRPGLENKTSALGLGINGALGLGQGIFFYEGKVYSWNSIDPGNIWTGFASSATKTVLVSGNSTNVIRNLSIDLDDNLDVTEQTIAGVDGGYTSIIYTGSVFVALAVYVSSGCFIVTSPDAITWTVAQVLGTTISAGAGAVKGTTLCFIDSAANRVATSTNNGVTWTETNIAKGSSGNNAMAVLGSNFTIGSYFSTNGTTWTICTGSPAPMNELVSNGSYLIGISTAGVKKFSNNGSVWSTFTTAGTGSASFVLGTRLAWSGTMWCGVTPDGKSITSTDGTNWTLGNRNVSPFQIPTKLTYFDGKFYCLSQTPENTNGNPFNLSFLETSIDGVNWDNSIIDVALFNENPTIISGLV